MEKKCGSCVDFGLLVLRIGIGAAFIKHGYPKLFEGTVESWTALGSNMSIVGITFAPAFWGFMAAFSEAVGGLALVLGIWVRPAAFLMLITMGIATAMHIKGGGDFNVYSHALKMAVVFLAIFIAGGGKYAIGACFTGKCTKPKTGEAGGD
ncbi:MAG: DoxX family protein [Planctomycetes bacterium]|nr:DoxX family protein [Planctomycetota bacterium]